MQNAAGCSVGIFCRSKFSAFEVPLVLLPVAAIRVFEFHIESLRLPEKVIIEEKFSRDPLVTRESRKIIRELLTLIHLLHCVPRMNPSLSTSLSLLSHEADGRQFTRSLSDTAFIWSSRRHERNPGIEMNQAIVGDEEKKKVSRTIICPRT